MAKVKDINLHVVPMYGQVQFFGEGDEYPEWGDDGVAVSSAAATFLGMPDVETCSVSLHIYDEYEEVADVFYESMIAIGMNGLEVAYVEASSEPVRCAEATTSHRPMPCACSAASRVS